MAHCLKFWVKYQITGLRNIGCSSLVVRCATRRVSQTLCILLWCTVFFGFCKLCITTCAKQTLVQIFSNLPVTFGGTSSDSLHISMEMLLLSPFKQYLMLFFWHIRGGSLNLNYVRIETSPCFHHWPNDPMSEWWLTLQKQHSGLITWWRLTQ